MKKYAKKNINSPIEKALEVIASKWTVLVLEFLFTGTHRFGEIEKHLSGISPRTLSLRLTLLEEQGVISRKVYGEVPPKVEYTLTARGRSLSPVLKAMEKWGNLA